MKLGAETNTRWLWFITYIPLPLSVIAQIYVLFWLLDANQGGIGILFIIAELGLAIATIIGLHQFKPWGWYCIMVLFGIQLFGTPLKVHAKASLRYEVTQVANSYLQSQGRSPLSTSKPSIFDFEPMLTFFLFLAVWTIPNAIYLYRRRHLFGLETPSFASPAPDPMLSSQIAPNMPSNNMVTNREEQAYAEARRELDSGNVREGLWAKVCAEETEDERRKAQYVRYRAQQIWYAKNTAETEARRKTISASIRHWTGFVAKRIAIGFLLYLTWGVVIMIMFISMRFLFQHDSDNYGYWHSLMWIPIIIPGMLIYLGFPIYILRAIIRETKRRKAAHFGVAQSGSTHQDCKMNPAQE